jgi:protein MpaA
VADRAQAFAKRFLILTLLLGFSASARASEEHTRFCEQMTQAYADFKWPPFVCPKQAPKVGGKSVEERPILYWEFGNPQATNTTLVFSMVHGDEVTPLYVGLKTLEWMEQHAEKLKDARVVIAPLINPDGYFKSPRTRTNARGVDVNRNFNTSDWKASALLAWKNQYKSNPRRYPGPTAHSEPETVFQTYLIEEFKPQKILSIHAPLGFMDYDGPNTLALSRFPKEYVKRALELKKRLKAVSGGFFPGSLGNYAGQERGIPTFTLELPTADPKRAQRYWNEFRRGIETMVKYEVPKQGG